MFCLETFILDIFQITEKKQQTENQQLFDEHSQPKFSTGAGREIR